MIYENLQTILQNIIKNNLNKSLSFAAETLIPYESCEQTTKVLKDIAHIFITITSQRKEIS